MEKLDIDLGGYDARDSYHWGYRQGYIDSLEKCLQLIEEGMFPALSTLKTTLELDLKELKDCVKK